MAVNRAINIYIKVETIYKVGFFILLALLVMIFLNRGNFLTSNVISNSVKEDELRKTYLEIIALHNSHDCTKNYDYLIPSEKINTTLADFVANCNEINIYSEKATINSIEIKGDEGLISRTIETCYSQACVGEDRYYDTGIRKYFYVNGKWYFSLTESVVYCLRDKPYSMLPEFERAVSLIIQRLENSQYAANTTFEAEDRNAARYIKKIYNCLNIQYAQNDSDLSGAEGVFHFDKNSSNDDLRILVSPKYQSKDDLLTATLLRHEISHAAFYASGDDKRFSCYENEAYAFASEIGFLRGALNDEERASIVARYNYSPEAKSLIDLNKVVGYGGKYIGDAALKYVKQSPFYQKQCQGK